MISKIQFINDNILGNKDLNFINSKTNKPYEIVILAGENGSFKTTILERISNVKKFGQYFKSGIIPSSSIIEKTKIEFDNKKFTLSQNGSALYAVDNDNSSNEQDWIKFANSIIFCEANINYSNRPIQTVTARTTDDQNNIITKPSQTQLKYGDVADTSNNTGLLKQLMVDIFYQDSVEWRRRHELGQIDDDIKKNLKMERFINAFNDFFNKNGSNLKFNTVKEENGEHKILFTKNGIDVELSNLSSGEKQIIYRAVYLLKDMELHSSPIILVDEPEASLHPAWQKHILQFYKKLFNEKGAQIIVATHSPYILQSLFNEKDWCILRFSKTSGWYISTDKTTTCLNLKTPTIAEINNIIFEIESIELLDLLAGRINDNLWCDAKKTPIKISFNETSHTSHNFKPLPKPILIPGKNNNFEYKTFICFVRNYYHHANNRTTLDKYIQDNKLDDITKLLHIVIDECKTTIKQHDKTIVE